MYDYGKKGNPLGEPWLPNIALNMCSAEEKYFLKGVYKLQAHLTVDAMVYFDKSIRANPRFFDSVYMSAATRICLGRIEDAKQRLFALLRDRPDFYGVYVSRFLPRFRLMFNVCYGYHHPIRPVAADVCTLLGALSLREGKILEAKKLLQQGVNAEWSNYLSRIMLARALFADKRYDQVIKFVEKPVYDFDSGLDAIALNLCGKSNLALGDVRTGLLQMDASFSFPYGKDENLLDGLRIETAREYEARDYLLDAYDTLKGVTDSVKLYRGSEIVGEACRRLMERVKLLQVSGIRRPLRLLKPAKTMFRRPDFWELKSGGA